MNKIDRCREILDNCAWLELDIAIDIVKWVNEANLARHHLANYRESESSGWSSVALHGQGENTYTDPNATWTDYSWTKLSQQTPHIKSFWQHFPFENLARIRFMGVEPGGHVGKHADFPPSHVTDILDFMIPVNVAIIHSDLCFMELTGKGKVPFKAGKAFIVNIRNEHTVINNSDITRIHLIAHGRPGNRMQEFCDLVIRSHDKIQSKIS